METKFNFLLNARDLEDRILSAEVWKRLQKLTKSIGDLETQPGKSERELEAIIKGLDSSGIISLITTLDQQSDVGSFRLHGSSHNRRIDPYIGKQLLDTEGSFKRIHTINEWGGNLQPLPVERIRDERKPMYTVTLSMLNLQDEPLNGETWRCLYVRSVKAKINHSWEAEFSPGTRIELIYRKVQIPQLTELIRLITSLPDVGSFILTCTSSKRLPVSRQSGALLDTPLKLFQSLYNLDYRTIQKMGEQLNERDERSKSDTVIPVR